MIELTDKKREIIKELAEKYSLRLVLLFGSQVSGKTHKESDYDIGYLSKRPLDLNEEGKLIIDLMPVLEINDERLINLVNIKKSAPLLLHAITSQCEILHEGEAALFATLRASAFKKYIEMKPLYEAKMLRAEKLIKSYDI